MPVVANPNNNNPNLMSFTDDISNHQDQFLKLIGNISSFQSIQQIQRFMVQFITDLNLKHDDGLNTIHNILYNMLTATKRLFNTQQLQRMVNSSQYIASLAICNESDLTPLCPPSPSPVITPFTNDNNNNNKTKHIHIPPMTPLLLSNRSSSLPLQLSLYSNINDNKTIELIPIKPITHILELPNHIISYCCSYLATKDLLLSADLICTQFCEIARMPSSFHGKFIFGSAIHCEYHKLITSNNNIDDNVEYIEINDVDINNGFKMLQRFHHSKEIHFINIFNYDTIQLLKTCNFPKIESIYLYDRFNHLIEYLPSLIPNVNKLYVTTNGGNETLDIIQANTNYYSDQLCTLFTGYASSIKAIELKHNTYYDIPLMLPDKVTKLLLNKIPNIKHLSLKNVYFPPDIDQKSDNIESLQHLHLMPYNEYCSDHFDSSLRSLSIYWNVVGQNDIYDMIKLNNLKRLHILIKLDNDSLDYLALQQFIIQSECLLYIDYFQFDIDLNDAVWSSFEKVLEISKCIFNMFVNNKMNNKMNQKTYNKNKYIKINIIDICHSTSYSHLFDTILPQIILNIINNIQRNDTFNNWRYLDSWNITIDVKHRIPDCFDNDYYTKCCMNNAIRDLNNNCSAILNNNYYTNINIKFIVSNQIMFNLQTQSNIHSIYL